MNQRDDNDDDRRARATRPTTRPTTCARFALACASVLVLSSTPAVIGSTTAEAAILDLLPVTEAPPAPAPVCTPALIDDFSAGAYRSPDLVIGTADASQVVPVPGGRRTTRFISGPRNPYRLPATLVIPGDGKAPLVASSGYQGNSKLQVGYGFGKSRELVPLNANLSCFDRFRVRVAGNDLGLNLVVQVKSASSAVVYQDAENTADLQPTGGVVEFAFKDFVTNDPEHPELDWKDIDRIMLQVQPTVAVGAIPIGSIDYAIARFSLARSVS